MAVDARDDAAGPRRRRRLDGRSPVTGRAAFQYLSSALDSEARFLLDRSISRQSPFHPRRTVSAPSEPIEVIDQHFHGDFRHRLPFDWNS
jgi:hypothetical protein